jgi:hypothetical protein
MKNARNEIKIPVRDGMDWHGLQIRASSGTRAVGCSRGFAIRASTVLPDLQSGSIEYPDL